jgi:molybdate transport system substrate-binding protein
MVRELLILWFLFGLALPMMAGPAAGGTQELTVSAAASLTNAFQDLGQGFEKIHPGTKIIFNFAASGPLLQQISLGAPVDLFASADERSMDQAQAEGLIVNGSRKNFVSNRLVLIVPAVEKLVVKGLTDLKRPAISKIALGNPETVPAGRYAQEALTGLGLWDALAPKFIFGESVRQVLDYVARGEVDAGLVYVTDAALAAGKIRNVQEIKEHRPIVYSIAVVAASGQKELAQRFQDYVMSPQGREILGKYGFGPP